MQMSILVWGFGIAIVLGLAALTWLNLSKSAFAQRWREQGQDASHALDVREPEPFPHMHVVNGVVITHSHVGGDEDHHHETITMSIEHYAELVKRAE